jgi:L-threonylcarbamoyladenylate synthase
LAANALDAQAVGRIFEIKGRPANNPVIVHVASVAMAKRCVTHWPAIAERLVRAFWPGPLTLVLPRAREIPDVVTGGGETVGVRWPSHPFIQATIRACGFPLAAPSANLSTQVSPTSASHVLKSLAGRIPLVVDGGPSTVGIESTVLDLTARPLRILRPGMVHEESLLAVLPEDALLSTGCASDEGSVGPRPVLRSPGQLRKHYSPRARLMVLSWRDDVELDARLGAIDAQPSTTHVIAHTHVPFAGAFGRVCVLPRDPAAFARAIYAELHRCDEEGAQLIIVERLPETSAWRAIADRLWHASA